MTIHPIDRIRGEVPPSRFTHHVWYDTRPGSAFAMAVCGALIQREHSVADPTCPICRQVLFEYDETRPELEGKP